MIMRQKIGLANKIRHVCYQDKDNLWSPEAIIGELMKDDNIKINLTFSYSTEELSQRIHGMHPYAFAGNKVKEPVDMVRVANLPNKERYENNEYSIYSRFPGLRLASLLTGRPNFFYKASDFTPDTVGIKNRFIEQVLGKTHDSDGAEEMIRSYGEEAVLEMRKVQPGTTNRLCACYEPTKVGGDFTFNKRTLRTKFG